MEDKLIIALSADIKELQAKLKEAQGLLKGFGDDTEKNVKPNSLKAFELELQKLNKEFRNTAVGTIRFKELATQIDATKAKMANATSQMAKQSTSGFDSISGSIRNLIGAYVSLQAVQAAVGKAFDTSIKLDAFNASMKQVLGSSEQAELQFQKLSETANKLGLDVLSLADSYKSFAGSTITAGVSQAQTNAIFNAFAGAASKLRLSAADMEGSLRAVAQMFSKGTVQSEELRGQLGERLPGAFAMAAKSMGVTTKELGKILESGQVLAVDLVPRLAAELEKMGGTDKQVDSLQASVNRLNNTFTNAVASGNVGSFFKGFVDGANDVIRIFESPSFKMGVERFIFLATGNQAGVQRLNAIELALKSVNAQLEKSQQLASGTLKFDFTATELLGNLKEQKKVQAELNAELKKGRAEGTLTVAEQAKLTMQLAKQNQLVKELDKIEKERNKNTGSTSRPFNEALQPISGASEFKKEAEALFKLYKESPASFQLMGDAYSKNPFFRDMVNGDLKEKTDELQTSFQKFLNTKRDDTSGGGIPLDKEIEAINANAQNLVNILGSGLTSAFDAALISGQSFGQAIMVAIKNMIKQLLTALAVSLALTAILGAFAPTALAGAGGFSGIFKGLSGFNIGGGANRVAGAVPTRDNGNQSVSFEIRGDKLYGVLENYQTRLRGIS